MPKLYVTAHAKKRFRERISKKGDVETHVLLAGPVSQNELNNILDSCPCHKEKSDVTYLIYKGCVFVVKVTTRGSWIIKTCFRYSRPKNKANLRRPPRQNKMR